jgi:predicted PurR-regulated permease PerM
MPLPSQISPTSQDDAINRPIAIASWLLAVAALLLVLHLRLLLPLLCGLLVHQLVRLMSPLLQRRVSGERARMISVALVASVVIAALAIAVVAAISFLRSEAGSLPHLLGRLMRIIDEAKGQIPSALAQYLPTDVTEFRSDAMIWAREHMSALRLASGEVVTGIVHAIIGMVLGGMVSLYQARPPHESAPLAEALTLRMRLLADAFHRVVFAQIRISLVNTALTAAFLLIVLPLFGVHLPLTKTMILVTFFAGLLPVVGNLISNAVVVLVALSASLNVAIGALVFLVAIHKFEYFLNARIVGTRIHANSWELLAAMLLMEAAYGLPGLVAAPVYYAYLKNELMRARLV